MFTYISYPVIAFFLFNWESHQGQEQGWIKAPEIFAIWPKSRQTDGQYYFGLGLIFLNILINTRNVNVTLAMTRYSTVEYCFCLVARRTEESRNRLKTPLRYHYTLPIPIV